MGGQYTPRGPLARGSSDASAQYFHAFYAQQQCSKVEPGKPQGPYQRERLVMRLLKSVQ